MDINFQLNNIREQFKNMDNQVELLITQSQNMLGSGNIQTPIFSMAIQIFNMGIQMVNIGTQIPSIGMDIINYKTQIQNIGCQIQNLGNQMNNINNMMPMNFNMNNMGMMGIQNNINNIEDDDFIKGFKMGVDNQFESINNKPKMNVSFTTTLGNRRNMTFDYGTSVGEILKKYLMEVGKPEYINNYNKVSFLYNAGKLDFDNKMKIEDFFGFNLNPKVIVNDLSN